MRVNSERKITEKMTEKKQTAELHTIEKQMRKRMIRKTNNKKKKPNSNLIITKSKYLFDVCVLYVEKM